MRLLKEIIVILGDFLEEKLKTPTGKLALVIINCLILGGSLTHAFNINSKYNEVLTRESKETKRANELQEKLNNKIETAEADCNERLKAGMILDRELRHFYSSKAEENYEALEHQKALIKEQEKVNALQENNIKILKKSINE